MAGTRLTKISILIYKNIYYLFNVENTLLEQLVVNKIVKIHSGTCIIECDSYCCRDIILASQVFVC